MAKKDKFVYVTDFLAKRTAGLVDETGAEIKTEEAPKEVGEKTEPTQAWDEKGKKAAPKGKGKGKSKAEKA